MITQLLEKSIRRTEAIDREALCILAGEKVRLHFPGTSLNEEIEADGDRSGNYDLHYTFWRTLEICSIAHR